MTTTTAAVDVVTVLDRVLAEGISREALEAHLAAGRIAVDGRRVADPQAPAPPPLPVQIMLDPA